MRILVAINLLAVLLAGGATAVAQSDADNQPYPKPELLIEADQLKQKIKSDKNLVVLDTRTEEAYSEGHIPTAQHVKASEWKSAFDEGTDVEGWSKRIAKLGIDSDSTVVVYDEGITSNSARVWWTLKYWGVKDVRILNGGTVAWQSAGLEISTETPRARPTEFQGKPQKERLITYRQLKEILGDDEEEGPQIIDARSAAEFTTGRIALCEHLDWQQLVHSKTGKMRPASELRVLFERVGLDPAQPGITYCQSGGRSAVMAFALELMGGDQVANYYGSWGEWSRKEGIDAKPDQPQAAPRQ